MMLGKTAGGLFWLFRYLERAENVARLLEAGWRMALTRSTSSSTNEWQSIVATAGLQEVYEELHDTYDAPQVVNFLLREKDNPYNVMAMMTLARSNARQVRTALSSEVWESVNEAWMDLKAALTRPVLDRNLYDTLALIRARTSVVRGALHGTMLRNDIFSFCRLGTFVERAESTARILDVKYYVLLPSAAFVGSAIDNAQWEVILSSVSAARSYRWINAGKTSPMGVAEFVILDQRMPRSLAFCAEKIGLYLNRLEKAYDRRQDSQALADHMRLRIEGSSIEAIFQNGLHEFLSDFIADTNRLSLLIEQDFRFYE